MLVARAKRPCAKLIRHNSSSSLNPLQLLNHLRNRKAVPNHYKRSTPPISVPLNKLFSGNFPLSLSESIKDYAQRNNVLKFQHELLQLLPFYPGPDSLGRTSEVLQVDIGSNQKINEFVIYSSDYVKSNYAKANHLIMVHGYGAGLGFYIKNFDDVSTIDNWVVHAIDLLGYGCSSRPPFQLKQYDLDHVEEWFHSSFGAWLKERNIPPERTLVMAHSMGAYLVASYGFKKDSNFCKKLLMVSPGAIIKHKKEVVIPKYFEALWERNISPFTLVRVAAQWGSKLVSGWSYRRFAKLTEKEKTLLHKYTYGIFQAPGSGEYMLNYLLKPGANPRHPMVDRPIEKLNCKVSWWYGADDWMNKEGGEICSNKINKSHHSDNSEVIEIDNAGHHVYLDNIKEFNRLLMKEMKKF